MNHSLRCTTALLLAMLGALPARAQTPLVVGSVRDQSGAPIEGARVSAVDGSGRAASAATDRAGTFALHAEGVSAVSIECRYCLPARVAVRPGEPVVAIVRRYQALVSYSPSSGDVDNLPYAHVESSAALRPFSLLAQSSSNYPGSRLSDRGLSGTGSLTIDDTVPYYDVVWGESPYWTMPANYQRTAELQNASNAYLYGNQAGGGTAILQPFLAGSNAQAATIGGDTIARAQVGSDASALAFGTYSNDEESRQSGDGFATLPVGGTSTLSIAGGSQQGREYGNPGSLLASSFTYGDATFSAGGPLNLTLSALADRGSYALTFGEYPIETAWSDTSFTAGIRSNGSVAGFADLSARSSSGFYDAQALPYGPPRIGATLAQTRADAGVEASGTAYDVTAGVGAFWINYGGGSGGYSWPAKAILAVPSLQATLFPSGKWSVNLQGSGSFDLPTFVQQYGYAEAPASTVALNRNALFGGSLDYTDFGRLRLSFEAASESVRGADDGSITSAGVAATWQVAPALSLRAWTMHVTDTAPVYSVGLPYGGNAPTVGALWLTYDNGGAMRVDAIYRRDLLDNDPFYHVDGDVSGPISHGLRWYAGAEDRLRRTFVDAGLRFETR